MSLKANIQYVGETMVTLLYDRPSQEVLSMAERVAFVIDKTNSALEVENANRGRYSGRT